MEPKCLYCKTSLPFSLINDLVNPTQMRRIIAAAMEEAYLTNQRDRVDVGYLIPILKKLASLSQAIDSQTNSQKKKELKMEKKLLMEALSAPPPTLERFHCPSTEGDDCSGWLDETTGLCNYCGIDICVDCIRPIVYDIAHSCDPVVRQTIETIKNTTRPCPSCRSSVTKTEGCSHMFCTVCKFKFDWRTLQEITGKIINPHMNESDQTSQSSASSVTTPTGRSIVGPYEFLPLNQPIFEGENVPSSLERILYIYNHLHSIIDHYQDKRLDIKSKMRIAKALWMMGEHDLTKCKKVLYINLDRDIVLSICVESLLPIKRMLEEFLQLVGEMDLDIIDSMIGDLCNNMRQPLLDEAERIKNYSITFHSFNEDMQLFIQSVKNSMNGNPHQRMGDIIDFEGLTAILAQAMAMNGR